jgi:drug/metabolite transporter (DMT)-like permease
MYFFGPQILAAVPQRREATLPPAWIFLIYVVLGVVLLAVAGIRIFAGIRNLSFKGRTLGIIAVFCGLITSLTIYCAPTSIGLVIYGLIVYLDSNVAQTFRDREAGVPPPRG